MNEDSIPSKLMNSKEILNNAEKLTELSVDLQQKCIAGKKFLSYLRSLFEKVDDLIFTLNDLSIDALKKAKQISVLAVECDNQDNGTIPEFDRIVKVIDEHLSNIETIQTLESSPNEHRRFFEATKKNHDFPSNSSLKNVKSDVDEKYPEDLSKDSLIDLNNVVNLPPVPEDIFTCFSGKPKRSSSLSSLKSMRKVKLFLQKAESSEEDENSSENEDHDFSKLIYGDNEELVKATGPHPSMKKLLLGNIKEESVD